MIQHQRRLLKRLEKIKVPTYVSLTGSFTPPDAFTRLKQQEKEIVFLAWASV